MLRLIVLAFCIVFAAFFPAAQVHARRAAPGITLWYWDTTEQDSVGSMPLKAVRRPLGGIGYTPDAALRLLLEGPNATEKAAGVDSDYDAEAVAFYQGNCATTPGLRRLVDYYIGVTVSRGTATVNFRPAAMCYLNAATSSQEQIKEPIYRTLRQFSTIKKVRFAINGKVVKYWDA